MIHTYIKVKSKDIKCDFEDNVSDVYYEYYSEWYLLKMQMINLIIRGDKDDILLSRMR